MAHREARDREVLYGIHPVREALRAKRRRIYQIRVLRRRKGRLRAAVSELERAGITVVEESHPGALRERAGPSAVHQGIIAIVSPYPYASLDDVLDTADGEDPLVLVVDSVTDPQNLGALLRSAEALGASGAMIPRDRAAPVTPATVRASAGAAEHLPVTRVVNLRRALDELKEKGLWIAAAVTGGTIAPWEVDLTGPLAVVVGSEEKGIRPLVAAACDHEATFPLRGAVGSLNAGSAGTALLAEVIRQRAMLGLARSSQDG